MPNTNDNEKKFFIPSSEENYHNIEDEQIDSLKIDSTHLSGPSQVFQDVSKQMFEENKKSWGNKFEFILSCLSYAVGLGNVWRYPYLCYKNGGGAFLLPYVIMLILIGIPMLFLESVLGQYARSGPITVWHICPIFQGIGWSMFLVTFFGSIYYCVLIAWTLYYFFASFNSDVPWRHCDQAWASKDCLSVEFQIKASECRTVQHGFYHNTLQKCFVKSSSQDSWPPTTWPRSLANFTGTADLIKSTPSVCQFSQETLQSYTRYLQAFLADVNSRTAGLHGNNSHSPSGGGWQYYLAAELNRTGAEQCLRDFLQVSNVSTTSSEDFFHNNVLQISQGLEDIGLPRISLVLCLLLAWIVVGLCLVKGIQSAGKAVYFTSLFPYVVLVILFVRALSLDGSLIGLKYYFLPRWEYLLSLSIWGDAAVQIFFSLNPCWGGIIALSSYNKFHNNILLDSMLVAVADGLTSIFAGSVIFSILGYMAFITKLPIESVARSGAGLAFITYPDIVTNMPISPIWAILFFAMLLTLGFGSMISNLNMLYTSIVDRWPNIFLIKTPASKRKTTALLVGICAIMFLLGIPCTTRGGMYVLTLMDNYAATYAVILIGITELVVLQWVFGANRFSDMIVEMIGPTRTLIWKILWKFITPGCLIAIAIFNFVKPKRSSYNSYAFPVWADLIGVLIVVITLLPIPGLALNYFRVKRKRYPEPSTWQLLSQLSKPDKKWRGKLGDTASSKDFSSTNSLMKSNVSSSTNLNLSSLKI